MKKSYRCSVTGRVQGVFFRQGAKDEADRLGITGWVRNEEDGSVTVVMCSTDEDKLTDFQSWLHRGSAAAHVTSVEVGPCPIGDWNNFSIR